MNDNNKNLTGLVNVNADNIYANYTIENVNASYFKGITSNIQTQINSLGGGTGSNTFQSQIDTLNDELTALTVTEAADTATNVAAITTIQTEITGINTSISTIDASISTIDENITTLQTKTQLQTGSTTSTIFTNMVKVNNGVSDQVILNNTTDGKNYINNKTVFENDINMISGSKITTKTTGGQFNLGDDTNVGLMQIQTNSLTGTITLTGNTINLNAAYVNVNGLIFSVNALLNDTNNYFSQF